MKIDDTASNASKLPPLTVPAGRPAVTGQASPVKESKTDKVSLSGTLQSLSASADAPVDTAKVEKVRAAIADHFHGALTAQDQHPPRLHITIQNKVTPQEARTLQAELGPALIPLEFRFTGLGLHLYRGPDWEELGIWKFRGKLGA